MSGGRDGHAVGGHRREFSAKLTTRRLGRRLAAKGATCGSPSSGAGCRGWCAPTCCASATTWSSTRRTTARGATPTRTGWSSPTPPCDVDTGFLVYNERTYPLFCRLLDQLGVATQPSDMSFGVADVRTGLEWRATSPSTVFAQRRNVARPAFWRMLADIGRFNRLARGLLRGPATRQRDPRGGYGSAPLVHGLPRLVPGPARIIDLVGGPDDVHPDPGGHLCPLLRAPRALAPP